MMELDEELEDELGRTGKKTCRPTSRTDFIEGKTLRNEGKGVWDTCRKGCGG